MKLLLPLIVCLVPLSVQADPIDAPPTVRTLTKGIVCESMEAITTAFDWASEHPEAQYVDLTENPGCFFISMPITVAIQPLELHENDVAAVVIGQATPPNGDVRYIWLDIRMKPQPAELDA